MRPVTSGLRISEVDSPRKMAVICVLAVILCFSYRSMEALLHLLKLPWREPVPGHSTMHEAFRRFIDEYFEEKGQKLRNIRF